MSEISLLKRNSLYYFISSLARLVANSLIFIIIARIFGAEEFGLFSTAHTLSTLFLLLADFGFDILITTEIARYRNDIRKIVSKYFPIKFVFTLAAAILLAITNLLLPIPESSKTLVFIFLFNMVFTSLLNLLFAFFRGIEKFKYEAIVSSISNFGLLTVIGGLAYFQQDLVILAVSMVAIRLFSLIVAYTIFKKNLDKIVLNFNFVRLRVEFKKVMIFGFHLLFGTLFFQIDSILILAIRGEFDAGLYQAVFKLMMISLIIPDVLVGALMPTLTRLYSNGDQKWMAINKVLFKCLYLTGLLVGFLFFSYPEFILDNIYKKTEFLDSVFILKLAGIVVFIRYFFESFAASLTVCDKQSRRTITVIVASFLSISLNIIFLPIYGITVSIVISIMVNFIAGVFYLTFVSKSFLLWFVDLKYVFPLLLIVFFSTPFFNELINSEITRIIVSVFIFVTLTLFINFSGKERQLLFAIKDNIA
ncbi:MAG: oligosaccharide flippase family protein [Melioribacteraceae bacterium]|nr:MAG: oligosaccharide flippase family protein [Melioribacteraceae bacterium]